MNLCSNMISSDFCLLGVSGIITLVEETTSLLLLLTSVIFGSKLTLMLLFYQEILAPKLCWSHGPSTPHVYTVSNSTLKSLTKLYRPLNRAENMVQFLLLEHCHYQVYHLNLSLYYKVWKYKTSQWYFYIHKFHYEVYLRKLFMMHCYLIAYIFNNKNTSKQNSESWIGDGHYCQVRLSVIKASEKCRHVVWWF